MKAFLAAILATIVCSLFAVDSIGAECHGPFCRVERSVRVERVRVERVRELELRGIKKVRTSVRWVARGHR